jgi:hypothetical protein
MVDLMTRLAAISSFGALMAVAGCGGDNSAGTGDGGSASSNIQSGTGDAGTEVTSADDDGATTSPDCPMKNKAYTVANSDTYTEGLTKTGAKGLLKVSLLQSSNAPPRQGVNTWTVQVVDMAGQPVSGATFTWTKSPYMPCMDHGSSAVPEVTPADQPGTYTIDPVYLIMPGIWTIKLDITTTDGKEDTAVFQFNVAR